MTGDARHTSDQLSAWHRDGGVLIERFFTGAEVAAVARDFRAVFEREQGGETARVHQRDGQSGSFHVSQFATFQAIPFTGAPVLNLIGVHPALMAFAKAALKTDDIHLYQCQAWAKFTGDADYDQPLHCDFVNHTLTVPSEQEAANSLTIICYFTDVTEAHGPMHYVTRPDSEAITGPEGVLITDPIEAGALQEKLLARERSSAAPAGSIFPYGIDVWHRGTNMTAPGGVRFAVMACFKRASDAAIGYHAWPFHNSAPWPEMFNHATPEQLACFGVPRPGLPFWTETTLNRAAMRYPKWDLSPYRQALGR